MLSLITGFFLLLGWLTAEHFPPWVSWHNELWVFAAAIVWAATSLARHRARKIKSVTLPGSTWVVFLLVTVVWTQYALGSIVFLGSALAITFYLFLCLLALVAGREAVTQSVQLTRNSSQIPRIEYLATVILLGASCSAGIALAQVFQVADWASWITPPAYDRRPGANLGQPNQLATFLLMGLASLLYLFEAGRLRAVATVAVSFLLMCGFVVAESRTGLLGLLLLMGWWMARRRVAGFQAKPYAVLVGTVATLVLFWCWPPFISFVNEGGVPTIGVGQVNTSPSLRTVIWPQLVDAALQRPWMGWGLGELAKAHNAVVPAYALSEPYTYAHNIVLDLAIGVGLPLTALLVTVAGVWLWRSVRATQALVPWYCLAVVLPFGVHSLLEFPFAYSYFLAPALYALGVLEGTLRPESQLRLSIGAWATAVLVMSIAMVWSVWEYILIEEDFRIARFEGMHIGKTASDYVRPKVYLLTQLDAMLEVARMTPTPSMPEERIALLRDVTMHWPTTAAQNRYALALALNGRPEEATKQLNIMRAMHFKKEYAAVREIWLELGDSKYPQLKNVVLP